MKLLIAEDDPISRRMIEAFLMKWGYEVIVTTQGEEAWQVLQRDDAPRMALLDWMMPGMDGLELCREVRKREGQPYTYLLLLTAKGGKRDIVAGLEAGADDYLSKPFNPHELLARLHAGRRIIELQEHLLAAREMLREKSLHDPLTGLWNRSGILDFLERELARAMRQHTPLALAMIDLDHFKAINDTFGHLAGDVVLREVGRRLRMATRTYDALGRYGGDEFLAVVSGCPAEGARTFAENFRVRIDREAVDTPEGLIAVTLSLGVAGAEEARELTPEAFLRAADAALYRAKARGRNQVEMATPEEVAGDWKAPTEAPPSNLQCC